MLGDDVEVVMGGEWATCSGDSLSSWSYVGVGFLFGDTATNSVGEGVWFWLVRCGNTANFTSSKQCGDTAEFLSGEQCGDK